jgi:putative membrane protein
MSESWKKPITLDPDLVKDTRPFDEHHQEAHTFKVEDVQEVDDHPVTVSDQPVFEQKKKRRFWTKAFAATTGLLLTGVVVNEVYRFIQWGFELNPIVGVACSGITGLAFLSGAIWLHGNFKGLRQLRKAEALHSRARLLQGQKTHGEALPLLKELDHLYEDTEINQTFKQAIRQVDTAYNDGEIIRYVSDHALKEQDQAARACVRRHSVQAGLMVALSPYATFDMYLVGWRNLKMLRELAEIYGIAPGAVTQWQLLKQVLHNIAFAGLSEVTIHAGSHLLGASITQTLSARAGQGIGASLFTARSGRQAIRLCRPLPLTRKAQSELERLNEEIISDVANEAQKDQ